MKSQTTPSIPPRQPGHARWTKWIAAAAMIIASPLAANAADYIVNFEGTGETKTSYASGNVTLSGISWNMTEVLIGTETTNEFKIGARSARLRGYAASSMTMLADKTNGAGTISFLYRRYGTDVQQPWAVEYSTDGGSAWTQVGAQFTAPASDVVQTFSETLNQTGNIRIRIICKGTGTSNRRLNIDDIVITDYLGVDSTAPTIATLTPGDNATDVPAAATTALVIVFSENIAKGTGDITLKLTSNDSTVATIPVTDTAVAISGATATITLPASLAASTGYYVNVAAGAFKDASNNNFAGIADKTTWNFATSTPDVIAPAVVTLSPADNSGTVLPTTNLVITYDEGIVKGNGTVAIKKSSDASVVESIAVSSGQVAVSGSTATIDPSVVLDYATGYYVEVSAGAFTDAATNGTAAVSGASTWNFTTRPAPAVVISQYYEGISNNKFIELKNLTSEPIALDGYTVTAWSNTDPAGREGWKSGTNTTTRITDLSGYIIPANGHLLIAQQSAAAPVYAAANFDVSDNGGCTAINGDDSVVLYNGPGFTQVEVVDAVSFVANDGADKSFYRLNNGPGFDFNTGSSILNYSGVWATKTLEEVASALESDAWYLGASQPIGTLTLGFSPTSFAESAGPAVSTATVTRSGDTSSDLIVLIANSNSSAAEVAGQAVSVTIPAGFSSAQFAINAKDNPWLTGNQVVTFTVSATGFLPASAQVTVLDDPTDPAFPVVINEVDADQAVLETVNDASEFIELYNNSNAAVSLDGVVLVLYNGGTVASPLAASYLTIDLSGYSIPAHGFFVVGNPGLGTITFPPDTLQNGADAVALYIGNATAYPNGTLVSAAPGYLVDAVVYDTNDADATQLLNVLTPGKPQVDEGANPASETVSISRVPNGGAAFDTTLYTVQAPTPGSTNMPVVPPSNTFANWMSGYDFSGFTSPDLSATGDPDNDGLANSLENILGSSPAAPSQGLTNVSTSSGSLIFRHTRNATPASDLTASYEWSTDLSNWQASGASAGGITVSFGAPVIVAAGTPDLVEVTATITGGSPAKVFARYKVVK